MPSPPTFSQPLSDGSSADTEGEYAEEAAAAATTPTRAVTLGESRPDAAAELPAPIDELDPAGAVSAGPVPLGTSTLSRLFGDPAGPVESPLSLFILTVANRILSRSEDASDQPALSGLAAAAVNNAPTATLGRLRAPSAWSGSVSGNIDADDPDGDRLTYTGMATAKGVVTVNSRGSFTYKPSAAARHVAAASGATDADKVDSFVITVSDGNGGVTEVPVTVEIRPANTAPSRVRSSVEAPEPLTGVVTGMITASDRDGDTFTYSATAPKAGTVTIAADGTFTYTASEASRTQARSTWSTDRDSFTITVDDGHGGTKTITVRPTIAPANTAPGAGTPSAGTPSTSSGSVRGAVNAVDPEGDRITYTRATMTTTKGKFSVTSSGRFTYTPSPEARHQAASDTPGSATDTVTVTAKDQYGAVTEILVTIAIAPKNAPPTNLKFTVTQPNPVTGMVTGTITATDADGDVLMYSGPATTDKGSVVVAEGGTFTYVPTAAARNAAAAPGAPQAAKTDNFAVTVTDGHGGSATVSLSVSISPAAASGPTLTPGATASVGNTPLRGVVSPDGKFVYVVNNDDGSLSIVDTASNSVVKTVTGIGDKPVDVAISPDGKRVYVVSQTKSGTFTTNGIGVVAVVDAASQTIVKTIAVGRSPVAVVVSSDGKRVYVANEEPNVSGTGDIFNTGMVSVISTDTDGVVATIAAGYLPADLVVSPDNTRLYITNLGPSADSPSGISVVDTTSLQTLRHIAVGINPNRIAVSPDGTRLYVTDWSSEKLWVVHTATNSVLSSIEGPTEGVVVSPNGRYVYTVQGGDNPDNSVAVVDTATNTIVTTARLRLAWDVAVSSDGKRLYAVSYDPQTVGSVTTFVIGELSANNRAPQVGTPPFTVIQTDATTGAVQGRINVTDADGDTLAYFQRGGILDPGRGSLSLASDGSFIFRPTPVARHAAAVVSAPASAKTASFTITVIDSRGGIVDVPVSVAITPSNADPTAFRVMSYDGTSGVVIGRIHANDADGDGLTYSAPAHTEKGAITVQPDGTFTYTPTAQARHAAAATGAPSSSKVDAFTITVSDGHGGVATVSITPTILGANALPVANGWTGSTDPLTGVIRGTLNVTDTDGDVLTFTPAFNRPKGTLEISLSGAFTYTPNAAARYYAALPGAADSGATKDAFIVSVMDGHGGLIGAPVEFNIAPAVLDSAPAQTGTLGGLQRVFKIETAADGKIYAVQKTVRPDDTKYTVPGSVSIAVIDPASGYLTRTLDIDRIPDVSDILVTASGAILAIHQGTVVRLDPTSGTETVLYAPPSGGNYDRLAAGRQGAVYLYGQDGAKKIALNTPAVQVLSDKPVMAVGGDGTLYIKAEGGYSHVYGYTAHVTVLRPDGTSTEIHGRLSDNDYPIHVIADPDGGAYIQWDGYNVNHITRVDAAGRSGVPLWASLHSNGFGNSWQEPMQLGPDGLIYLAGDSQRMLVIDPRQNKLSETRFEPQPGFTEDGGYVVTYDSLGSTFRTKRVVYRDVDNFAIGENGTIYSYEEVFHYSYAWTESEYSDGDDFYWRQVSRTVEGSLRVSKLFGEAQNPPATPTHIFTNPTSTLYQRLRQVTSVDHAVVVEKILGSDGAERLVVYIGGTNDVFGTNQSWVDNIPKAMAGALDPDLLPTIDEAVRLNGDLPIMLVGYSQGGIDAQNIAASGRYRNVTSVVTFGTVVTKGPNVEPPIPNSVNVVHFIDENDPIPYYFTAAPVLDQNENLGNVFMWRGGVLPDDPHFFWGAPLVNFPAGYINIHADPSTYLNIGMEFDNPSVAHEWDYAEIKADLDDFRGQVLKSWRSERPAW